MAKCFIKLIIPCYNVGNKVGQMLDSILNQTFTDYHIVCVEDCSKDNALSVLEQYQQKYPYKITLLKNKVNSGAAQSRNYGYFQTIDSIKSEYVWFVDGDDRISDWNVLQKIHDYATSNENLDLIYVGWTNERGQYAVANIDFPIGLWGMVIRTGKYVSGISVQPGDDFIPHYFIIDSIPDSKIGVLDYNCYTYPETGGRCLTNGKYGIAAVSIARCLMKRKFLKESVVNSILGASGKWILDLVPNLQLRTQRKTSILMASFPYRKKWMLKCIEQLIPQCDNFYLWLNEYDKIPQELEKFDSKKLHITLADVNLRDNGRYTFLNKQECKDDYCFICDDDINYPPNYIQNSVECFDRNGDNVVIAHFVHNYNDMYAEYKNDYVKDIHTNYVLDHYRFGSGTCAFVPSLMNFNITDEQLIDGYDVEMIMGIMCAINGVKVIEPKRPQRFVTFIFDTDSSVDGKALHLNGNKDRIIRTQKHINGLNLRKSQITSSINQRMYWFG